MTLQNEKRRRIVEVAKLYYHGHMTQEEISGMLNISRTKVTRILQEAEKLNIVRITVNDPYFDLENAAEQIRTHFNLKYVCVVASGNNPTDAKTNIGKAASAFLNASMTENIRIGISWGSTVSAFVCNYRPDKPMPNALVVQMVGGLYIQSLHIDGRELAKELAQRLNCQLSILQTPLYVHNPELRSLIMQEPETIEHFAQFEHLDIAFVGIGSQNYKESVIYKANYIDEEEAKRIYTPGLCDICGHHIDQNGCEPYPSLANRLISISLESIRQIPMVVGLCSGKDRAMSIISSIRGGYLKGLVIDEIAAFSLLETEKLLS